MKTCRHFWSYLAHFFLEWEMFQTKVVEKFETHILSSVFFPSKKSCRLWDNLGKYCTAGQATDDNMAPARCMLVTKGYRPECVILLEVFADSRPHLHNPWTPPHQKRGGKIQMNIQHPLPRLHLTTQNRGATARNPNAAQWSPII